MSQENDFTARFDAALARRLGSRIVLKELLRRSGIDKNTLQRARAPGGRPTVQTLEAVASALASTGDTSFLAEVFGLEVGPAEATAIDQGWWVIDDGTIHPAPAGHNEFARRYLGLQPFSRVDALTFVQRNLGWVAIAKVGGAVRLEWSSSIAPSAAWRTRRWLETNHRTPTDVTCIIDGQELQLSRAAVTVKLRRERVDDDATPKYHIWASEPIDSSHMTNERLIDLLASWRADSNGALMEHIAKLGLLPRAVTFALHVGEVLTTHVGSEIRTVDQRLAGKEISDIADKQYVEMLRADLASVAQRPGWEFRQVSRGAGLTYRRLAIWDGATAVTLPHDIHVPEEFKVQ